MREETYYSLARDGRLIEGKRVGDEGWHVILFTERADLIKHKRPDEMIISVVVKDKNENK